jgi:hypothetical protein
MGIGDLENVEVDEQVVLSKYEGDSTEPEAEFERVVVVNGDVVEHVLVENGEVVGPVPEEQNLTGTNIGRLMSPEEKEER